MQGWIAGQPQEQVEESGRRQHYIPHLPHYCLLNRLLCIQEQQDGQ